MPERQTFLAGAHATVDALAHDIWAVWADVNAWKNWDPGICATRMRENFKAGTTFTLTPQGGEPLEVTITTVTQGENFSDETPLPFGVIRNHHRMEQLGERVRLTHEVEAVIDAEAVPIFAAKIWPGLQRGVSEGLLNLADLVDNG